MFTQTKRQKNDRQKNPMSKKPISTVFLVKMHTYILLLQGVCCRKGGIRVSLPRALPVTLTIDAIVVLSVIL